MRLLELLRFYAVVNILKMVGRLGVQLDIDVDLRSLGCHHSVGPLHVTLALLALAALQPDLILQVHQAG